MPTGSSFVVPHDWTTSSPTSADRFQRLAEDVMFLWHQKGTAALSFSASAVASGPVTFPVAFAAAPVVQLTGQDAANLDLVCAITARSTTSFSYRAVVRNGTTVTGSATLHWVAFKP